MAVDSIDYFDAKRFQRLPQRSLSMDGHLSLFHGVLSFIRNCARMFSSFHSLAVLILSRLECFSS